MRQAVAAAVLAAAAAAGAAAGYRYADARGQARLARCEHGRAEDARAAAAGAVRLLDRAQQAEVAAAARLAAQKAAFDRRIKEVRSEIYRLSSGRECLSGALRLRLDAALGAATALPAPAGGVARAPAGSAADPGHRQPSSTDADVAGWILEAARLYDDCRARLDALRQWDAITFGSSDDGR